MVTKEQRRRELARAKLARQQARRESEAKRRRLMAIIAAAVAVVVVVVGITYLSLRDDDTNPVAEQPTSTAPETTPPTSEEPTDPPATPPSGICAYRPTGDGVREVTPPPDGQAPALTSATATIETDQGVIELELDPSIAPCTVQSFLTLADGGFYDDTTCHRLTTSRTLEVLQCGDPSATGGGGPGYAFDDEVSPGLEYTRGTLAMANSGPNTNGSQFFLVYGDSRLPPDYTVFGTITAGLEVLDAIAESGIEGGGSDGAPATPVTITAVTTESVS